MMAAYYNEIDDVAAQWLRNLIDAGHIAPGVVDQRSIADIDPDELTEFRQCHFFAGIGVWSHALRRAGWPDDAPVWTGSCPCQPFSAAGKKKGFDDERHLWPVWFNLIQKRRPAAVLGEQVASALEWLDLVSADLETTGYAFGASDLCAAGFDGAHIRQRLYFVGLADPNDPRSQGWAGMSQRADQWLVGSGSLADRMADTSSWSGVDEREGGCGARDCEPSGMANADHEARGGWRICGPTEGPGEGEGATFERSPGLCEDNSSSAPALGREVVDWLGCRDGKWRPVGPGTFPLADAPAARVGRLRAYGNALDAETATQFCASVKESIALIDAMAA
jgi:DNA (cytosine-5)-methyltransferase 1